MNKADRIARIRASVPKRVFFEPCFVGKGNLLLRKISLSYEGTDGNNVLNSSPLLTREQEFGLFRRLNFLKYRVMKKVIGFNGSEGTPPCVPLNLERLKPSRLARIERDIERMTETRNLILTSNTRLIILSMGRMIDRGSLAGDEFFSEASGHIIKAIDYFDHRRGFKFSTYCVNVLKREAWRFAKKRSKEQTFSSQKNELDPESHYDFSYEINRKNNQEILEKIFTMIGRQSRGDLRVAILKGMFGIGQEQMLLREVGDQFGMTKERIRQLKEQSLSMAKKLAEESRLVYDPV